MSLGIVVDSHVHPPPPPHSDFAASPPVIEPNRLKMQLREVARARLRAQPASKRTLASGVACERLMDTALFRGARSVMLYMPMREELDVSPVMNAAFNTGKRVCLPRMDWPAREMMPVLVPTRSFVREIRRHGIAEPGEEHAVLPISELDLVLVPGLAFDAAGHRLGRGAGFYDRFLERFRAETTGGVALGVGFDFQVFTSVPTEAHDHPLDGVVTDGRLVMRGGAA